MSLADRLREHVAEHRSGMVADLAFAVVWVTVVSLLFEVVDGPQWAYYLFMLAGVGAYFAFFWSLRVAREQQ
ncbi:hypothetical protein ACFQPA_12785 [Halomarina halobia]|uniref:DUF8119 domain-containing protein n=1 Tax=Halomarina halobia TaxID=3033386 RepID=A0ABD6A9J8_9EURY|nr:hypothetical protein [Halomarina sp. PSR21]